MHALRSSITVALLCVATTLIGAQRAAAQPPQAPCADAQFRALDFWVGEWDLSWENADGTTGFGRNSISRDEYGDCVIFERFSSDGLRGMSVSTYDRTLGVWRQTWVDNAGGYFALSGGPGENPDIRFELRNTRLDESKTQLRMIWQKVSDDALTWRWQSLPADANPDTGAWVDRWVIRYTRRD